MRIALFITMFFMRMNILLIFLFNFRVTISPETLLFLQIANFRLKFKSLAFHKDFQFIFIMSFQFVDFSSHLLLRNIGYRFLLMLNGSFPLLQWLSDTIAGWRSIIPPPAISGTQGRLLRFQFTVGWELQGPISRKQGAIPSTWVLVGWVLLRWRNFQCLASFGDKLVLEPRLPSALQRAPPGHKRGYNRRSLNYPLTHSLSMSCYFCLLL